MTKKTRTLIQAAIVCAITLAFILPGSAVVTHSNVAVQTNANLGKGEWYKQDSNLGTSQGVRFLDAVDNDTAWAVARDGSGSDTPTTQFTMTTNGGALWTTGYVRGIDNLEHGCGNICALSGTVAYAAVYNHASSQDVTCGPWKTSNGGLTWTQLGNEPISFCNNVIFWDENHGVALGDTKDGYFEDYFTSNGGTNWTRVPQANYTGVAAGSSEGGWTGVVDVIGNTVIFGSNMGNVFISNDRGHTYFGSYSGCSSGGTNGGVNVIAFRDSQHGMAGHDEGTGDLSLYATSDGGHNWTALTHTGTAYDYDVAYCPGTTNMYISTGANYQALYGASYSMDGGATWTDYPEVLSIQMMALDAVEGKIAFAGAYPDSGGITGGMYKHIPGTTTPEPILTASISGGKGFTIQINNIGDGAATGVTFNANITGGLFMKQREFPGTPGIIAAGGNYTQTFAVMGIGLGIIKPKPVITLTVTCNENKTAGANVTAKIFFSKVTI